MRGEDDGAGGLKQGSKVGTEDSGRCGMNDGRGVLGSPRLDDDDPRRYSM